MSKTFPVLVCLALWTAAALVPVSGQATSPSSLGCWYDPQDSTIRCRNTTLDNVVQSFRVLSMFLNTTKKPQFVDISFCQMAHLPYLFPPLEANLKRIGLTHSQLEYVYPDAFAGLQNTLQYLDLSHNKLHSLPYALSTLRMLRELHVQNNQIVFLRPGPVFENLLGLRVLNLANNFLGLSRNHIVDLRNEPTDHQLAKKMDLEDFNLEPAIKYLEVLDLSGNKLASFPKQLHYRPLPSLRSINVSDNLLESVPTVSSALPNLKSLDLRSNRIQELPFYAFPTGLAQLELSGNPFRCDCAAAWLSEWARNTTASVAYPDCHTPPSLANTSLSSLSLDTLCPFGNGSAAFRYVTHAFGQYNILELSSNATAIRVTWHTDRSNNTWHVVYRMATDHPNKLTLSKPYMTKSAKEAKPANHEGKARGKQDYGDHVKPQENRFTTEITNLMPSTNYIVCVAVVVGDRYLMEPEKCRQERTKDMPRTSYRPLIYGGQINAYPSYVVATDSVASAQIHVTSARPRHEEIKTVLTNIVPHKRRLVIVWKVVASEKSRRLTRSNAEVVEEPHLPHEWVIRIRKFATFNVTEMRITDPVEEDPNKPQNRTYQYTVSDLAPGNGYDICLEATDTAVDDQQMNHVPNARVIIGNHHSVRDAGSQMVCKEIETLDEAPFPATEIAVATTVSTSTTVLVVIMACFWCPCCRRKRRDNASKVLKDEEDNQATNDDQSSSPMARLLRKCKTKLRCRFRLEDEVSGKEVSNNTQQVLPPLPPQTLNNHLVATQSVRSYRSVHLRRSEEENPQDTNGLGSLTTSPEETPSAFVSSSGYFGSAGHLSGRNVSYDVDGYLTPLPRAECQENNPDPVTSPAPNKTSDADHRSSNKKKTTKMQRPGEMYINPEDIQYISGKNVQIFVRGSRTLPRKCHGALLEDDQPQIFHPRYSLPHAFKRKRPPVKEEKTDDALPDAPPSNVCRSNTSNGLWFHPKVNNACSNASSVPQRSTGSIRSILKPPKPELTTVVEPWTDVRPRPVERQFYIEHV